MRSSSLTIDTVFEGDAGLGASFVTIGPTGRVDADIFARTIEVLGSVSGNLIATDVIHLRQGSSVRGNLRSRRIQIENGASFQGRVDMD